MLNKSFNIDFDAQCDKCGKKGRCPNGLCLACIAKALREHYKITSWKGIDYKSECKNRGVR